MISDNYIYNDIGWCVALLILGLQFLANNAYSLCFSLWKDGCLHVSATHGGK